MTQEEIIKLAHTAGFNWPDIQATTIEQRLERFAALVAAAEREKFTNTQEFVTLPRAVVEQAIAALTDLAGWRAAPLCDLLRAALEQPQVQQEPSPVAKIIGMDEEYGPMLLWHRAWADFPVGTKIYTHPQPKREPLKDEQSRRIYDSATYAASLAVFMTRMDAEHPDADDKGVSGWLQEAEYRVKSRITEASHNIK